MSNLNVIIGPPCAGKSTHVLKNKAKGDIVVDADALAKAIGSDTPHGRAEPVRGLALKLRHSLIERVLEAKHNAWVIHTSPSKSLIHRYKEAGATFTVLDPGMDECLARAATDERPEGTESVIRQWYASPPQLDGAAMKDFKPGMKLVSKR